jgi:hypothetical protein
MPCNWPGSAPCRSGTLDVMELQKALALGQLNFSLKTVQAMMRWVGSCGGSLLRWEVLGGWLREHHLAWAGQGSLQRRRRALHAQSLLRRRQPAWGGRGLQQRHLACRTLACA